jgi:hypothetical protein
MKSRQTLTLDAEKPALRSAGDQTPYARHGQIHSQWRRRQRREPVARIEPPTAFNLRRVPAIEHIKQHDGYPQCLGRSLNLDQAVEQQVATETLPLIAAIDPDHRDEACRDLTMAGPCPGERRRQVAIIDRMGIEGVKTDDLAVERYHHAQPQIVRTGELVGGSRKEIIDRRHAGTKAGAIMMGGIEGLDPVARRRRFGHRVEIVA